MDTPPFEKTEYVFTVLDGPVYTKENRPSFWRNDIPLDYRHFHIPYGQLPLIASTFPEGTIEAYPLDIAQLPLHLFPLIEDFEVILEDYIAENKQGKKPLEYNVLFFSPSHGYLAHFLMGDYTSNTLRQDNFVIPFGSFVTPYFDFDQGWQMLLAADAEFVYILTGILGYETWFKVEETHYYQQWEKAIQRCCEMNDEISTT